MNVQDRKEFEAMVESNRKFDDLYSNFVVDVVFAIERWGVVSIYPLRAKDLKEGRPSKIMAIPKRGKDKRAQLVELTALMRRAERYARRLSEFFPEARRWHWQEVFFHQALSGTGTVFQSQSRGRLKESRPQRVKQKYNRIINLRFSTKWNLRTDEDFLEAYPEYNRSVLARAKRWNNKGKP